MASQDCEICRDLPATVNTDFGETMPAAAARLIPDSPSYPFSHEQKRTCPLCGTRYHYTYTIEWAHGSGHLESETLERLPKA